MKKYLFLLLLSTQAFALTPAQISSLHDFVVSDTAAQACVTAGDDGCLFNYLNSASAFIVWKTRLADADIYADTGFDFTLVDGLTAGKRDEWKDFLFKSGFVNPSKPNIRAAFADIWSGTTAKTNVQNAILVLSKRAATFAEKVLATGTGTTASPGTLTFEGNISFSDLPRIREQLMATTTLPQGTRTALTISGFSTLASGTYVASSAYNCDTNKPVDVAIEVEAATTNSPAGNKQVVVFMQASLDGTNFQSGPTSGTTGTDEPDLTLLGTVPINTSSTPHRKMFSIMASLGFIPKQFKIICKNDLGVSLTSGAVYTAEISAVTA